MYNVCRTWVILFFSWKSLRDIFVHTSLNVSFKGIIRLGLKLWIWFHCYILSHNACLWFDVWGKMTTNLTLWFDLIHHDACKNHEKSMKFRNNYFITSTLIDVAYNILWNLNHLFIWNSTLLQLQYDKLYIRCILSMRCMQHWAEWTLKAWLILLIHAVHLYHGSIFMITVKQYECTLRLWISQFHCTRSQHMYIIYD